MKYNRANILSKVGTWEYNVMTGILDWDHVVKYIYELNDDFEPTIELAIGFFKTTAIKERVSELTRNLIQTGDPFVEQFEIRTAKGNTKWVEASGYADFNNEQCVLAYGTLKDISYERDLDSTLQLTEEKFSKVFESAAIGMALVSPMGYFIKVNKELPRILGYTEEELIKLTFQNITHPDDLSKDLSYFKQVLNKEIESYRMEKRYIHKLGHIVWAELSVSIIWSSQFTPLYFISQITDITEQKKASEELQREQQRLYQTIEGANIGTWEWNIKDNTVIYNNRWAEIVGYTLDELQPISKSTWSSLVHPDDKHIPDKNIEKCFSREIEFYECEYRMRHKNGSWVWINDRGKIVEWSAKGQPLLMLGTHADITQTKSKEQELRNTLDLVSEQNKRLLNFTHITSHNLRSHIGNFQMLLNLLPDEPDETKKRELIDFLITIANNLQETVHYLNEVLQIQTNLNLQIKKINLYNEVEKVLTNLKGLISESLAIVYNLVPPNLEISYSAEYIESVLINLITNAIKYQHPDRIPVIHISVRENLKYIILEIADNGMGIDLTKHGQKLFGMYKTFHQNKDARGLGLFITKNQVEALGGKIEVESTVDIGSTFKVCILHPHNLASASG
ncbi:HAMP domain-containing sensor histidine kinase [Emticicia sp. TH156]|uniref:sensor histidine kinase n=1 Tax=Emticicia sp. TH156 TaxID=2067454 RepID=UPI000C793EF9|nr:HAMP domain-containing sensor histidine kinase [Emticicia sp. TH156]PLK43799.1 hypothetical protein C0V77_14935 [Emticicia sp. TH156]